MSDVKDRATEIVEQFEQQGIDCSRDHVLDELETLVMEYRVPLDEAERSVRRKLAEDHGVDLNEFRSAPDLVSVGDIESDEEWVDVQVTVADLWEPSSDSIGQVGLVGDESGTIKFISWAASNLPALEEGESYRLENVVTDEYEGRYSIKLNKNTEITKLDEAVEVGSDETEREGALVAIQSGSGLIKRCPEEDCSRALQNGRCADHGAVEGEFDLRIKAVLDDGTEAQDVHFDEEATEALTGIDLEEAKEMAKDALDTSVVIREIRDRTLGHYLRVMGSEVGRYLLVNEVNDPTAPDHETALSNARSI
jgi:replication factor A1